MGLFSRSKKKDKKAAGGDPPEGPSSSAPGDPTSSSGNNDLTAAVLALSSADPDGCCEAANVLRAEADRGRVPASPAIKSGAVAALLSLVRGPGGGQSSSSAGAPPSGQRGVAALSAEVAALRREWREQDADRCARHAANALAAIASADPEGRPALTLVPFLLDALLTRAESRASSAAARGAAAGGAVPPRGRTPRQVGHRVAPRRGRRARLPGVQGPWRERPKKTGRPVRIYSVRRGRIRRDSSGGGGSRGRVVDRHRARRRSERARGRQRFSQRGIHARRRTQRGGSGFSTPGTVSSQALGAAAGNDAAQVVCAHLSHRHLDELAAALVNGHRRRRRGRGERRDEVNGNGNLDADDVVTARAATLANTCAVPACAANVARSPATLDALSRSLRSTRGLSVHTAGDSTGGGGGDGGAGRGG